MVKELVFVLAQPDDSVFLWQMEVQINNFRKFGLSDKMRYLMFLPHDRLIQGWNPKAKELQIKYPEVKFFWYEDKENILDNYIVPYQYIPLLRPYILALHFKKFPELKDKAIFYMDTDVVFTKNPDFIDKLKDDDVCYLSDTISYIGAAYWDSKQHDVMPSMLDQYRKIDPLQFCTKQLGISREIAMSNEKGSGGAQYLLKNIDHNFWLDVFRGCLNIRATLSYHVKGSINNEYFESENKGFQSWCADMWSVLWNLWKRGITTSCPKEMDFAWATDKIDKWDKVYIYHDAGATGAPLVDENGRAHMLFYKRKLDYVNNKITPFDDGMYVLTSPEYCSFKYCEEIGETANKINKI